MLRFLLLSECCVPYATRISINCKIAYAKWSVDTQDVTKSLSVFGSLSYVLGGCPLALRNGQVCGSRGTLVFGEALKIPCCRAELVEEPADSKKHVVLLCRSFGKDFEWKDVENSASDQTC